MPDPTHALNPFPTSEATALAVSLRRALATHLTRLTLATLLVCSAGLAALATDPAVVGEGHIEIYFTTPGVSAETAQDSLADDALVGLIDSAQVSVDLCLYDFNYAPIIEAVMHAWERGVTVRFVGDADEADQAGYIAVADAGIPAVLRTKSGIMHHKFVVADGRWVATGSMNASLAGAELNNNNLVVFDDLELADSFTAEFDQMFVDGAFGASKVALVQPQVTLGSTTVEVAFGPKDDPELILRDAIATADHSVYFMVFSFTRDDVAADLANHHANGLEVVGIYDKFGASNSYATDEDLATAGLPILLDGNENTIGSSGGKLHHKVMIIDQGTNSNPMVVIGSYNWSGAASTTNDENLVILHGAEAVAPFMTEFCEVFDAALPHTLTSGEIPDPCAAPLVADGLRINELLANPEGTDTPEEYVELVNAGDAAIDLSGWSLGDAMRADRHVFDARILEPGDAIVVYGGANASQPDRLTASSGSLSLNNASETVTLTDPSGAEVSRVSYTNAASGQAINRIDDGGLGGDFDRHSLVAPDGSAGSPGRRVDGSPWLPDSVDDAPVPVEVTVTEGGTVSAGAWHHYGPFEATEGAITITMSGTADADLYVRRDAQPTDTAFDCRPFAWGSTEACTLSGPATFYVSVKGWDPVSDYVLSIEYTQLASPLPQDEPGSPEVVVDALLANPAGTDLGQEYVVIANTGTAPADLSGVTLSDASAVRHVFAEGTTLGAGQALVLHDRGDHPLVASTTRLSLNNSGDTVTLADAQGEVIDTISYPSVTEGQESLRGVDF